MTKWIWGCDMYSGYWMKFEFFIQNFSKFLPRKKLDLIFKFHLVIIVVEMFLTQITSSYLCNLPLEKKVLQCEKDWNVWCDKKIDFSLVDFKFFFCVFTMFARSSIGHDVFEYLKYITTTCYDTKNIHSYFQKNSQVFCYHSVRDHISLWC